MSAMTLVDRMRQYVGAWRRLRANKTFAGFTLQRFEELIREANDAREEISQLEGQLLRAMDRRKAADARASDAMVRISHAVRGDPQEGDDGEFYEALGFIPRSKRKNVGRRRDE